MIDINSLKLILNSQEGRQVLWEIMAECGTFQNAFTGNSQTFFLLGKQFIGQMLLGEINSIDYKLFQTMQDEAFLRVQIQKEQKEKSL